MKEKECLCKPYVEVVENLLKRENLTSIHLFGLGLEILLKMTNVERAGECAKLLSELLQKVIEKLGEMGPSEA